MGQRMKVSIFRFLPGDLLLFLPTAQGKFFYAFNVGACHHYLSEESAEAFGLRSRARRPNFVLGYVVSIDAPVATADVFPTTGPMANPYNLPPGTRFWVVTATQMTNGRP